MKNEKARAHWKIVADSLQNGGDAAWGGSGLLWALHAIDGQVQETDDGEQSARVAGITRDGGMEVAFDENWDASVESEDVEEESSEAADDAKPAHKLREDIGTLNIVILVVGTRGDVQPFVALGRGLKECGHRVRLASHRDYKGFVTSFGLEFYPLGGDPKVLSEFVVENRGVLPLGVLSGNLRAIPQNLEQLRSIIFSTMGACTEPDSYGDKAPFTADAIIANPPAVGHIHCAEKLKIPLHMMFTMPWSKTKEFMHPLARLSWNVSQTMQKTTRFFLGDNSKGLNRFIRRRMKYTYSAVENIMFLGLRDIINEFRKKEEMEPIGFSSKQRHILETKKVPFTYCWSPSFVPKPKDWGDHIDVAGFFFLNQSSLKEYTPPEPLAKFLEEGKPPVYIGFGSMVIPDAEAVNKCIEEAVENLSEIGVRALVSKGWGGLGEGIDHPNVHLLDNCPHDWLFPRCSGVVHHGGAGTTSAGLLAECPTFVVPFFGDQPFWGEACHKAGVGPQPVAIDDLTSSVLTKALKDMRSPEIIEQVKVVAEKIRAEDGVKQAVEAFHKHLPRPEDMKNMNWKV
ncbi:hypothetical protein BSKO_04019 [Bryopsis sp. KO-2023]|nr:hypothetical protein BSKO_04019 [Bryopsis sp. KO-2023]